MFTDFIKGALKGGFELEVELGVDLKGIHQIKKSLHLNFKSIINMFYYFLINIFLSSRSLMLCPYT